MKQEEKGFRSQASALRTGTSTVCTTLTYFSRMLRMLLSLSMEGINPNEGERQIQALVTGWHFAEDRTPRPCPPHYLCHTAIFFLLSMTPAPKSGSHRHKLIKISKSCSLWISLNSHEINENLEQSHLVFRKKASWETEWRSQHKV